MPLQDDLRLDLWRHTDGGHARLINLSENHTFRIDTPTGTTMLRVHRPGYQSRASIESELAWLEALRTSTDIPVVRSLRGRDGQWVQDVAPDRLGVLFAFEPGVEPEQGTPELFRTLGRFAATAHTHVSNWSPPSDFIRPNWTAETMLGPDGLWGDWRQAPGVGFVRPELDRLCMALEAELDRYGRGAGRFGLIHADMRLANLLIDGVRTRLLDFDDCGFGWFMYDLAAALSFIETEPTSSMLQAAWMDGYERVRPLSQADRAIVPAMVLLRRMVLLAWIGSHDETQLAQSQAPHFAAGTVRLGRAWLDQR